MRRTWKRWSALILAVAMCLSLLPAAALAAPRSGEVIDVTDYGADPTGTKESSTAVIAALEYAKTLDEDEQKTIVFPKGEYHFYEDYSEKRTLYVSNTLRWNERDPYAEKSIGILVEGMKNVTVDGGGSLFIYHGNVTTIAAIDSENVTFTNFSEDFASPEVVDVTVEAHEGDNAAILFIPACYNFTVSGTNINWRGETSPTTGQPYWSGDNGFLSYRQYLDTVTGQSMSNGKYPFSNVSSITKVDDTHIKVVYSNASSRPQVGQSCQMRHPNPRKTPGTFFWQSKDITVSNANFYFLHGFGMVGQLSENITLDTVKCQARPGTGRTSAGFADFVQMSSIAGKVTIRNCEFADPHDDPINIHGTFLKVTEITGDRRRVVVRYQNHETWGFPQYYVGDTVDFTVQNTLAHVENLSRTVVGVVNPGEGLHLDGTPRSKDNETDMKTIIVELDEPLPSNVTATDLVIENVTYTPEVLIENCRFTETPTRAILVTTQKPVVIRNNYFDRIRTSTIFISCDGQDWYESGRTEDVLITGNTFVAQSTADNDDHYGYSAIIMVWPTNGSNDPNYQIHKNLRIEDNDFYILDGMPSGKNIVSAKSVNGLAIKNNRFLRYTPNVSLGLAASSTALTAGGTQSTSLTSDGFTFANRLFRLQACKQVVFEGNTYDDGLNLGIKLDETAITTADNVTDNDGVLVWNGDNQLPAVGTVSYFSSDPTVATVDESGVVTGVSAGTAEIYAYRVAGARTFESNHLTFTVTGTAAAKPNKIDITSDKDAVDVNGTANLTAAVDPSDAGSVAWSVKPATDGGSATITSAGVLTATAPGVVEVTASLGGVTGSKLITVNKPNSVYLSDLDWTSANTGDSSWNGGQPIKDRSWESEKDGRDVQPIKVTGPNGEAVTFEKGIGTHADSTITYDLTGLGYTRFTAKVGVSYYKHDSNEPHLHFVVNGDGSQKFASSEMLGNTPYEEVDVDITGVNTLELKLTQPSNVWSAHGNWADAKLISENAAPTASGVAATPGSGSVELNYTYSDGDSDAESGSLVAWYVSDTQNGHYTRLENASSTTLTVTAATSGKWVKAVVVPRDATGRYGAPVTSAAVQAPTQAAVQNDATLASLSVAGLALSPAFDPEVTAYTVDLPASATKVTIAATATQATAQVTGVGAVTLTGMETAANITVTAPNGTTTKTYTVTIHRAASSVATLSNLTASAGSAAITYDPATRFYELVADQNAQNLTLTAEKTDPNATIAVRFNTEEKGEYEGQMTLPLMAGLNNLELRVTAQDGVSTALYRVRVIKPASSDATLTSLTVNGEAVTIPVGSTDLGLVQISGGTATLNVTAADGASVYLGVDGKAAENNAAVTLEKTLATATIRVVAEDSATENVYTLALAKVDPNNADLYLLKLEGMTLSPAFDKDTLIYTATFTDARGTSALTAAATQAEADVTCETVSIYETVKGRVARNCHFFRDVDENFVKITVTSPNGEVKKEYIVNVTYEPVVYLSDLQWTSHTSGWASGWPNPGVDIGVENNPMSLWNGSSWETFEKGLGTHANSQTTFDISGMGFAHFTAKVGPNQNSGSPHISFEVQGDGETLWSSEGEITHSDPYQTIDIDVTGVNTLKIIDNQSGGNGAAHATWADAKFYGGNIGPAIAETAIYVSHIEFQHESHTLYSNPGDPDHTMELHSVLKPIGVESSSRAPVLTWTSSNNAVATVNNGEVTAVAIGTAEISATALGGATDSCTVTVKKKVEGTLTVSGELRFGSELTANDNDFDQDVKGNLTYTWYRGDSASGTALGTGKTYTPVKEDIGQVLTVKASAMEDTFYEGYVTATTAEIAKAEGHEMLDVVPSHVNCSAEGVDDGQITGLREDHVYQYQKQDENGDWPTDEESWIDVPANSTEITGLAPGNYRVRHAGDETREPGEPSNTVTIVVVGGVEVALNIPQRFEGGVVRANRSQIPVGDSVILTVVPDEDEGYELDTLEASYTDENGEKQTLEITERSDGKYSFLMPDFPVDVTATFRLKTYTIVHALTNITCSLGEEENHTATHGEAFSITLTPDEGYDMPRTLTLTETDSGRRFTDFTYVTDPTDSSKRVLTFAHGVTCNITVSGAATLKTYTVVYDLTNGLTANRAPQTVTHGSELSVTLTAARGYNLPEEITVTVAGAELTAEEYTYDAATGAVTIESVTGNVVITAQGREQGIPLQAVTVVGPARVGRTLTVNTVPILAEVTYQWIRVDGETETEIPGADSPSYTLTEADEGKTIKVRVTGVGDYEGQLTSAPTTTVLSASTPFIYVERLTMDSLEATVQVGKTVTLTATVSPENATDPTLYWVSSDESIATVVDGVVTGLKAGSVTITAATADGSTLTASCEVTVTKAASTSKPVVVVETPTEIKENEDGSVTTTVTAPDGTKVETTEKPDGSTEVVETKPDGTITETKTDAEGAKVEKVTDPEENVTIVATDAEGEKLAEVVIPAVIPEPETRFEDVPEGHWADEAIHKLATIEVVNGVGGNQYNMEGDMTRGALATVLHRLSNKPEVGEFTFDDVDNDAYYAEGVAWAEKTGVVKGFSAAEFRPEQTITREQLALMLMRYAKLLGMDTKVDVEALDNFADGADTHDWAAEGVAWCVQNGILQGKGGSKLDPTANVTRAQVAVMVDRFIALMK